MIYYTDKPIAQLKIEKYPTLKNNWNFSIQKLQEYNTIFSDLDFENISVVLAGSYGRLEASENSDVDFLIIVKDKVSQEEKNTIWEKVTKKFSSNNSIFPNPDGVFADIISITELEDNIGSKDDSLHLLAQRMLLILETKVVYNEEIFNLAVQRILDKYLELIKSESEKEALFLMNDLIRYFREICVNYQYNFWRENEKWALRNVKLRHSRIIMYAGTLLVILNASTKENKFEYILEMIKLTPLERISLIYQENRNIGGMEKVLTAYEIFLRKISSESIRNELKLEYNQRLQSPHYMELKGSADLLRSELTEFIIDNRKKWSNKVFEYLIF